MKAKGKIITVLGAQASGKSTLVDDLQKHIKHSVGFYEGEEFPQFVIDAFDDSATRIRAFLYFHNHWLNQYIEAEVIRQAGGVAILDTFWLTNLFYLDTLVDKNERQLIQDSIITASKIFSPPDAVIYLEIETEQMVQRIKDRAKARNRPWEADDDWLVEPLSVKRRHDAFFSDAQIQNQILGDARVKRLNSLDSNLVDLARQFVAAL
ncbi:MAG: AAA family ATPase [Saprospiraceae bacterium]